MPNLSATIAAWEELEGHCRRTHSRLSHSGACPGLPHPRKGGLCAYIDSKGNRGVGTFQRAFARGPFVGAIIEPRPLGSVAITHVCGVPE